MEKRLVFFYVLKYLLLLGCLFCFFLFMNDIWAKFASKMSTIGIKYSRYASLDQAYTCAGNMPISFFPILAPYKNHTLK